MPIQGNLTLDTNWDPENQSPAPFVRSTVPNENSGVAPDENEFHLRELFLPDVVDLADTYASLKDKVNALAKEVDSLDHNTKKYVDDTGVQIAIIEEVQPNGVNATGGSLESGSWWLSSNTNYDNDSYTESLLFFNTNLTFRFFQRNLNDLKYDGAGLVESFVDKKFTLKPGKYYIRAVCHGLDTNSAVVRLKQHVSPNINYGIAIKSGDITHFNDDIPTKTTFEHYLDVSGSENERTFSIEHGFREFNQSIDVGRAFQPIGQEVYTSIEITKLP